MEVHSKILLAYVNCFFVLVLFIQRKEAKLIVRMHVALVLLFASEDMSKKFHIKCNLYKVENANTIIKKFIFLSLSLFSSFSSSILLLSLSLSFFLSFSLLSLLSLSLSHVELPHAFYACV